MDTNKKKILLSIVSVLVVVGVAVEYYFFVKDKQPVESVAPDTQAGVDAANSITKSATQGVLPSISGTENPLSDKPDINPTSKTNPFQ